MECLTGYATYCVTHNGLEGVLCCTDLSGGCCVHLRHSSRERPVCSVVALNLQKAASSKPSLAVCSDHKLAVCLSQNESCHYLKGAQELLQELAESNIEQHAMSNYPVWYQHINAKLQLDRCGREALPVAGLLATHEPG